VAERQFSEVDAVVVASRALLAIVARTIAPALEQVSLQQFRVLVVLVGAGPDRLGSLAARLDAVPSTFSRAIDRMEHGGWVTRRPSPDSRREVIVEVTERGRALVQAVTDARRRELAVVLERVEPSRRRALAAAFEEFAAAAGEPAVDDQLPFGG
jgi:DNA-binding MarR family transcriptional regulator